MSKAKEQVHISHDLFPWETFRAQAEREEREIANDGIRWTDEFLQEVRDHIVAYAALDEEPLRNSLLNDIYRMVPLHFRRELFAGIIFPIWER